MGNAKLWFFPAAAGGQQEIDFLEGLSDLPVQPIQIGSSERSLSGRPYDLQLGGYFQARIVLERFDSPVLARQLLSLQSHLLRGGICGVAADSDKAWAGFSTSAVLEGSTFIDTAGTPFYNQSATLSVGDEVWVQSHVPERSFELQTVNAFDGNRVTFDSGLLYDYKSTPVMVRHRDFWPVMVLARSARNRPFITHDHRLNYTLDLLLEEHIAGHVAMSTLGGTAPAGGTREVGWRPQEQLGDDLGDRVLPKSGDGI